MFKINKKIIATVLGGTIALTGVGVASHSVTANADQISYQELIEEAKNDIQKELEDKYTKELEEKDNKINELQTQVDNANNQLNQLQQEKEKQTDEPSTGGSANTSNTNNAVTKDYVNKQIQQAKQESTTHTDKGDANLQQQVDNNKKAEEDRIKKAYEIANQQQESPRPSKENGNN